MNYILVIDHIATGGAERILIDYYQHLRLHKHNVTVFCLSGKKEQIFWIEDLNIIYGSSKDESNLLKKTGQQFKLYLKLRRLVKERNADILFSFLEKSNFLTFLLPTKNKKVLTVHNVLSIQYTKVKSEFIRRVVYNIIRWAYNNSNNVIAVSEQVKFDLINSFHVIPEHVYVINNYVNRQEIHYKSKEPIEDYQFQEGIRYIMNIGRFSLQKAQWKLLKAYEIALRKGLSNVRLVLMGQGEYSEELRKLAYDLGIKDKVDFLSFNVNPYKYMVKAHLIVLSSIFEGFPIVLAESSSLHVPFVGARKAVPYEMFDNKEFWEQCIFDSTVLNADFSTNLHEDEYALAELIIKGVDDEEFRNKIIHHTAQWERDNDKKKQFEMYDRI